MCVPVIIDASVGSEVWDKDTARFALLRAWVARGDGLVVSTSEGDFAREMRKIRLPAAARYREWRRKGRLRLVRPSAVAEAARGLDRRRMESDDPHVLALAAAAGVRVLCARDSALESDFKNTAILPHTPQGPRRTFPREGGRAAQKKFLDLRKCPGGC